MKTFVEKVQIWGNIRLTSCRNFVEVGEKLWKNVQCGNFSGISFEKLYLEFLLLSDVAEGEHFRFVLIGALGVKIFFITKSLKSRIIVFLQRLFTLKGMTVLQGGSGKNGCIENAKVTSSDLC